MRKSEADPTSFGPDCCALITDNGKQNASARILQKNLMAAKLPPS